MTTRNEQIMEARAAGRTLQDIADEHLLSVTRVHQIVKEYETRAYVEELENRVLELEMRLFDRAAR